MRPASWGAARWAAVVLAAALASLAGCASVPTTGPVTQVSAQPGRLNTGVEIAPAPPAANATPSEVVEGFLHAMASWQPNYAVARTFLTPAASGAWRPDAGVRIYAEGNPVTANDTGARLSAPIVGTLDPTGAYRQSSSQLDHDFGLVRDAGGQWRIANPPEGLIISEYLFTSAFTRTSVYFFAPGGGWLVPDPRYFPRGAQAIEGASRAVTSGPTAWLAPAIEPVQPWAAFDSVTVDDVGVARVWLRRGASDLAAPQREALAAQYVWTLRQFDNVTGVELGWVGESPWTIGTHGITVPMMAFADADPHARQTSRQLFGVVEGRIVRVVDGPQGLEHLVVAAGVEGVAWAAVRQDALVAAAVGADRSTLVLAPLVGASSEVAGSGVGLRRPQWSRQEEVWVPDERGQVWMLAATRTWQAIAVGGISEGRVTALRVAPDGVRVALVVAKPSGGSVLGLARIVRTAAGVTIEGWREVAVGGSAMAPQSVIDVGWRTPDTLLALASDERTTTVYAVVQDGSATTPIGPSNTAGLVELAVAPGVPPIVRSAEGDVSRYNADFRWTSQRMGASSVFYPG